MQKALTRPGEAEIADAKRYLDLMRHRGDQLQIDLAEATLNDLLERYGVTLVTRNHQEDKSEH